MTNDDEYQKQLRRFLIPVLRKKSLWWWGRTEAFRRARKERGFYECANCKQLFGRKEVHADHKESVISVKDGFKTWDEYLIRLFVKPEEYSILCIPCHSSKTLVENNLRKINKKKKKLS